MHAPTREDVLVSVQKSLKVLADMGFLVKIAKLVIHTPIQTVMTRNRMVYKGLHLYTHPGQCSAHPLSGVEGFLLSNVVKSSVGVSPWDTEFRYLCSPTGAPQRQTYDARRQRSGTSSAPGQPSTHFSTLQWFLRPWLRSGVLLQWLSPTPFL